VKHPASFHSVSFRNEEIQENLVPILAAIFNSYTAKVKFLTSFYSNSHRQRDIKKTSHSERKKGNHLQIFIVRLSFGGCFVFM
jgi:hypothetical protein